MSIALKRFNRYRILILFFICICPSYGVYANTATDSFVESLRFLRDRPDVEVVTIDETPLRKKVSPKKNLSIKVLEKDLWGGIPLGKLTTPRPQFEDHLIRKLTPDEYSKFYAAFTEGENASKENKLKEAVTFYTDAIAVAPFYYVGYMERAKILARNNKLSLAIQDFTTAIRMNPNIADPYIFRAVTRTKERQYGLALNDYQSAMNIIGNNPILLDKQGEIQLILGDFAGARISYTQAIEEKSSEARYYYQRAIANSGLNNYTGMIQDYLQAISTNSYTERLIEIRNKAVQELESKYYPREANPLSIIPSPENVFRNTASLPLYNPFQDVKTITPTHPAYAVIGEIETLQKEFPRSTFVIMQSYVAKGAYEDALDVLREYMQKLARTQYGFTTKSMLVFLGYLNQMLGRYEDANTAYSTFLHTTRKYVFFYCNYAHSFLKKEGFSATKDMILNSKERLNDPIIRAQILSYLAMMDKDYITGIRFMEQVVQNNSFVYYKLQLLALYALAEQYQNAFNIGNELLKDKGSPFLTDIYILYGLTALENGDYYIAVDNFSKAQQLLPIWIAQIYSYIAVAKAGKPLEALDLITEGLKNIMLTPKERMELYTVKAQIEYYMGNYTRSIISYTVALNSGVPDAQRLFYNLAFLDYKKKNYVSALDNINKYLKRYSDDAIAFVLRGDILLAQKQVQSALEDYKRAILLDKRSTYPYVHVANAIYALGIFDTARKYYLTILEKSSDDLLNYIILAVLNAQANNISESLEYCKRILERDPENIEAHLIQGIIYQKLGNLQDATKSYYKISELDPSNIFSHIMHGELLEKQKEYRKAITELTKAITINTFATEAYIMRGLMYLYLGDKTAGLLDLEAGKRLYILRQDKQSASVIESMVNNLTKQTYIP